MGLPSQRHPPTLSRFLRQYEPKGASQALLSTSSHSTISDSELEDDTEPRPKLDIFLPQAYCQPPDAGNLSPSEGADYSDDEFLYPEPDLDKMTVVGGQEKTLFSAEGTLACSMFVFAHQLFGEKGDKHDPLRLMQTRRMEFWDLPNVFLVSVLMPFFAFSLPGFLVAHSHTQVPDNTI